MVGTIQRGRKRPSLAISEDGDEQSDYSSSASTSSKRARHARDASDTPTRSQDNQRSRPQTQNDDAIAYVEDEFQAGSLVRVKLKNFVTYTDAEFNLGPSLNMVIGPNGTGKSTLVCAICLGLGWGSEHLGRAKDLGAFVKHGALEAVIEIELAAGPNNGPNQIVQRTIRKKDNKSSFVLNGKQSTRNAVMTMARTFSIQIDNLCQFLPQDRVVEFAKMSDVDRLRETQRAAAPAHMVEWHDRLKELRSTERDLETKQMNERGHLDKLDRQQNATRGDVERFHQREGLLQISRCLQKVKPIIECGIRKDELVRMKEDVRTVKTELRQIRADVIPVQETQKEVQQYQSQIEQVRNLRKNRVDSLKTQADKLVANIERDKQKEQDFTAQINNELQSRKKRNEDITRLKNDIRALERQHQEGPIHYDAASYAQRLAELRSQISSNSNQQVDKQALLTDLRSQNNANHAERKTIIEQRAQLDTQSGKRASLLQTTSDETARAWDWIQKNRSTLSLKGEVHGPPILECSIPDSAYASAVESQMRRGDFLAITCTNSEDQKYLSGHLLRNKIKGGLGLHDVHFRTSPRPLSSYQPPVAPANLPQYGLESYILDHIHGPDAVLAMLCENLRLHQIAYAARRLSDQQHAAVSNSAIRTWITDGDTYKIVTRREYNASSTSVTPLRSAKIFTDQPANSDEKTKLDERLQSLQRELAEMKSNHDAIRQEKNDLEKVHEELIQSRDELQAEQKREQKAVAEWNALPSKIDQKNAELDEHSRQNAELNNRIRAIKANARMTSLHVATLTLDYAKTVTQLRTFHESLVEAEIRFIEARSESDALDRENRAILQRLATKEADFAALEERYKTLRVEYSKQTEATQELVNNLSAEERTIVAKYQGLQTLDALEQEVQANNARLEMMAEGNPGAIRAYEKREEEIGRTREKLDQYIANLEQTKQNIVEIREQWEPELDALIRKISDAFAHNFKQIGCAGEVEVYKDEDDFDNWSIQISVRFREGEPLSVLNSHRQSGGERAVSTIFYLMALQDLAQSPFRVVDEINQGMDPRNERMVHERMVDIACQERTSQYFLVTPKLLTGLKFHPKMKVHVINSGEHIPDSKDINGDWDFRQMARVALRSRKGIAVA